MAATSCVDESGTFAWTDYEKAVESGSSVGVAASISLPDVEISGLSLAVGKLRRKHGVRGNAKGRKLTLPFQMELLELLGSHAAVPVVMSASPYSKGFREAMGAKVKCLNSYRARRPNMSPPWPAKGVKESSLVWAHLVGFAAGGGFLQLAAREVGIVEGRILIDRTTHPPELRDHSKQTIEFALGEQLAERVSRIRGSRQQPVLLRSVAYSPSQPGDKDLQCVADYLASAARKSMDGFALDSSAAEWRQELIRRFGASAEIDCTEQVCTIPTRMRGIVEKYGVSTQGVAWRQAPP